MNVARACLTCGGEFSVKFQSDRRVTCSRACGAHLARKRGRCKCKHLHPSLDDLETTR